MGPALPLALEGVEESGLELTEQLLTFELHREDFANH